MADEATRLLERQAAVGDPEATRRHVRAHFQAGGRDPRRNPRPRDVVVAQPGYARRSAVGRRVVPCPPEGEGGPLIGALERPAWRCARNIKDNRCRYVHWERTQGRWRRAGQVLLPSWRAWARGAEVMAVGDA